MIYTENKIITLNSKYGIQLNGTYKSNMLFNFQKILSDREHILKSYITVVNAQIPYSFYVITDLNNKLVIAGTGIMTTTIYITKGNYNANSFITELKAQFSSVGITFNSITFDRNTGILSFESSVFINYYFTSGSTILNVLGTTSDKTSTGIFYTCTYPLNLLGVNKLSIVSEKLSVLSVSSTNFSYSNILVTIPCDIAPYSLISYTSQSEQNKNLLTVRYINEIDIQIVDENNNFINMNNLDWTMTLVLSTEIEFDTQLSTDMNDILNKNVLKLLENQPVQPPEPPKELTQNEKELSILNY
jgi:hypothetical protein